MAADDDRTFDRFCDLPPEIRTQIYGLHFDALKSKCLSLPCQPPVTRASRLLRSEALPMFYGSSTFHIHLEDSIRMVRGFEGDRTFWLSRLSDEAIGDMRSMRFWIWSHFPSGDSCYCRFQIDFNPTATGYEITDLFIGSYSDFDDGSGSVEANVRKDVEETLRKICDGVVARDGMRKLKREVFTVIAMSVFKAW